MAIAPYEPTQEAAAFLNEVRSALQDFAGHFRDEALLVSTRELAATVTAVEELSKMVEQLQLIGAHVLDRQDIAAVGETDCRLTWAGQAPGDGARRTEFRNTAGFLRKRLKIGLGEARRRLRLGADTLPATHLTGAPAPPRLPALGAALAASGISGRAAALIRNAVERVRHTAAPAALQAMEVMLTRQAAEADLDILREVIKAWEAGLDPDGREPAAEFLRARQGLFLRGRHHGLHRIETAATDEQYEYLATVMNTSTNPRLHAAGAAADGTGPADPEGAAESDGPVRPAPVSTQARPAAARGPGRCLPGRPGRRRPAGHRRPPPAGPGHHRLQRPATTGRRHRPGRLHRPHRRRHHPPDRLRRGPAPGRTRR